VTVSGGALQAAKWDKHELRDPIVPDRTDEQNRAASGGMGQARIAGESEPS
jgi:hypothetical protein